ncbi:MAG: xanthine dehydrogenase family protein molybdopterin-binding subunit [Dehalococcoidia bacterium]|nr:xanthine dehydrogenase family protein molybdopterin-binding subunit [Dehalococcoidia bacterium]
MLEYKPNLVLSTKEYKVVGTRPIRHDGLDKVTGRARYGADVLLPGMLHAKILRSPHAHARIKRIDTSKALAMPGVKAVLTAADLPQHSDRLADMGEGATSNYRFLSDNCMASTKVLYKGHAVAAVAATSPHIAEEAMALIEVEYEVLPSVLTAEQAMKTGATLLHERLVTGTALMGPSGTAADSNGTNVGKIIEFRMGDLEKGYQEADVIVDRKFSNEPVHQGYIEPHTCTAMWDAEGNLTIWVSSQGHFQIRDQSAALLKLPVSRVKVIPMEIGGGFGGKTLVYMEPVAALLSRKTGHPVKITMTRTEVFTSTGPTSGGTIRVKMGATRDGRITAAEAHLVYEAGAYPGSPLYGGIRQIFAPYSIPNSYLKGFDVVVNKPKTAAYRAPGAPQAAFACEQVIDELAQKINMDPLEFRILNSAMENTRQATGPVNGPVVYKETLQITKNHPHYTAPLKGPYRGRGVAAGSWHTGGSGAASAAASVNADGSISLVEGSPDIGGSRAAMAMQLAEALGIAAEQVKPSVGDTDSIGYTTMTAGSGATFKSGWACHEAAQDIKRQMVARAARIWEVSPEDVEYKDAVLRHKRDSELRMTFQQLAARLNATGGPIVGSATIVPKAMGDCLGVHIVDVEVDPETGKVDILRYTVVEDVGKAIHPSYVEGQIQGGAVQGIGWALNEEYFYANDGQMMNNSFLDYRMPTALDLPMIDTVLVESDNPSHPYGLRGVGELPLIPPLAAIANAIERAIGVRITQLPMNPARILEALEAKENRRSATKK